MVTGGPFNVLYAIHFEGKLIRNSARNGRNGKMYIELKTAKQQIARYRKKAPNPLKYEIVLYLPATVKERI